MLSVTSSLSRYARDWHGGRIDGGRLAEINAIEAERRFLRQGCCEKAGLELEPEPVSFLPVLFSPHTKRALPKEGS